MKAVRLPIALAAAMLATSVALSAGAAEGGPAASGLEGGARTGYMLPFGKALNSVKLGDVFAGAVPIILDFGYRIDPRLYVGGFAQYAFGRANTASIGTDSSTSTYRFGALGVYHLSYGEQWDPWVGGAVAYEAANVTDHTAIAGTIATTYSGFQLEGLFGVDYRATSRLAVGPFAGLAVGEYVACGSDIGCEIRQKQWHGWLTLGARVSFRF